MRKKVEEEEKAKEMEDLYLPPRSRKTLQKVNHGEGKSEKSKKDESDDSSYDGSDEDQPRKRGRPRVGTKEVVKGFTDAEVSIHFMDIKWLKLLLKFVI